MKKYVFFFFTAAVLFTAISCSDSPSLFTVSYETNGIGRAPNAVSVPYGAKLTAEQLPVLTAEGKVFGGWFKESECTTKWDKNADTVTQDTILYAKWQNAQPLTPLEPSTELFTVTFNVQGLGAAPASVRIAKGEKLIDSLLPKPSADKKRFDGWYKESSCTTKWIADTDTVTQDTILYAKWTNLFTVTFNTNGVTMQLAPVTVEAGAKLTDAQLPNLTADGKLFGGWYKESGCTTKWNKDTDAVTKNITLYAKWQNASPLIPLVPSTEVFTVTFNVQGLGAAPASVRIAKGEKLIDSLLPKPSADKKRFDGWYKESSCTTKWIADTDTVTQDTILYAKWTNLFTVTFDIQGAGTQPDSITVADGEKLSDAQLPVLTAEGKVFGGWFKESECATKWDKNVDTVTQDTILYAKWQNTSPLIEIAPATRFFTVTFNVQGVGAAPASVRIAKGGKLTNSQLPNPTADKKRFDGWYKESSCTTKWLTDTDTITKDTILYAKWTNLFTVKFNTRGLVTAPADIEVANGEVISAIPANPSHLTWEFAGWHKDKKNSQAWNNSDKVTGDITLYAKWNPKTVAPTDLWKSKTDRPDDYYRIPAFAETKDGTLLAVTDLRYKHAADVGEYDEWGGFRPFHPRHVHRIDLILKRSLDYGKSWSSLDTNLTNVPDTPEYGCGDAAIVADRDSDEVLIIHVKGNVRYQDGKQNVAMLKSTDGGNSFTPTDITAQIYGMNASWQRMFVTSGKIHQSRFIKVDKYYRIYAAPLIGNFGNTVIYSDDFGDTWKVLGGDATVKPIPSGDEAKVEELPDGRVILSSRCGNGRYINIFTYTNKNTGEGNWQSSNKWLNLGNDSGTNGELLIVKACAVNDKTPVYLALQSIPAASGRNNVTIYWRTITENITLADFVNGSNWQQKQIHSGTSAYSTMILQKDGRIGFLYEYNAQGNPAGFDIKYKSLTIREITGNQYEAAFLTK